VKVRFKLRTNNAYKRAPTSPDEVGRFRELQHRDQTMYPITNLTARLAT